MTCDILSLEWNSEGRDTHIVEPVLCYLEGQYNFTVIRDSIWYGEFKLLKYKPKVLIVANATGASNNYNIMKLADKLGIVTVEFISEGVYAKPSGKEGAELLFWGWNKDKKLYSDLVLYWSEAMKNNFQSFIDEKTLNRIEISGGTGFDRYKLLSFLKKEEFLERQGRNEFKKVIGIAGWGFDGFAIDESIYNKGSLANISAEERAFFLSSRDKVNEIYRDMISNNKDILFILKHHPGVYKKELTEFAGLAAFDNTVEIVSEEKIEDVINISDLWICYESTSCIEAWLLNKQTIFVNPEIDFKRSNLYLGNAIAKNKEELSNYIRAFYDNGSVPTFAEKENVRRKLIEDLVGYDDGCNHKRAAEKINGLYLNKVGQKKRVADGFVFYAFVRSAVRFIIFNTPIKLFVYKKYKLIRLYELKYKKEERDVLVQRYHEALKRFHGK